VLLGKAADGIALAHSYELRDAGATRDSSGQTAAVPALPDGTTGFVALLAAVPYAMSRAHTQ
jgi:hypothetical protein